MKTCWKCGNEINSEEFGTSHECSSCKSGSKNKQNPLKNYRPIDWEKVQSVEDLKLILSSIDLRVDLNTPVGKRLKKYLQ